MPNKIQMSEVTGSCNDLLKAIDLVGLSDAIGSPGTYTCVHNQDLFDPHICIVPGSFTAAEVADLFKAAAFVTPAKAKNGPIERLAA